MGEPSAIHGNLKGGWDKNSNSKHSTKYCHMSYVAREIHTRQRYNTVFTSLSLLQCLRKQPATSHAC